MCYISYNFCIIRYMVFFDILVMIECDDYVLFSGKLMLYLMVVVYEFDEQGLIKVWCEYLDIVDLVKKKGVVFDQVGGFGLDEVKY